MFGKFYISKNIKKKRMSKMASILTKVFVTLVLKTFSTTFYNNHIFRKFLLLSPKSRIF